MSSISPQVANERSSVFDQATLQQIVDSAHVDAAVFGLRPDYRVALVAVAGLEGGPSDDVSETLLSAAEGSARAALLRQPVEELPQVAAWRDAYRAFGAKPQRTRNSVEALLRRAEAGLPRVNKLTDIYNAISILHRVPIGGEDLTQYVGGPRLVRAAGTEDFDTASGGETAVEHPEPGEVVWRDDVGVTCRRWNWRQCRRTQISDDTAAALFIIDALDPLSDQDLTTTVDELVAYLSQLGNATVIVQRTIGAQLS